MNIVDAAWLAGFLDGDGSFMICKTKASVEACISVTSTDKKLVNRCRQITGAGKIVFFDRKSPRWKGAYIWNVKGTAVGPIIEAVLPYLIGKTEQARLLLALRNTVRRGSIPGHFGKTRLDKSKVRVREHLYLRCKRLNSRGPAMAGKRVAKSVMPLFSVA